MMKKSKRVIALFMSCLLFHVPVGFSAELSLEEAIDMALNRNPDIKIAVKGGEKAQAQLEGAKGKQNPSITASTSLGVNDVNDHGFSRSNSNSIRLSMPLYTGGKNELGIAKAEDSVTASGLNLARTRENIALNTVVAYYNILQAEKVVNVDKESVNNYQQHLNNVQVLYSAGSTPKMDLLRSEVELVNAQQTLIKSQNTYDIAVSTLKNIIKMNSEEPLVLLDDATYTAFDEELASCIAFAKANRKDLMQYQVAVSQAQKDVEIARSDKKPSVSLAVGNSWDKEILPSNDNHSLSASVSASWNVFDSNVTNANIKAAEIAIEETQLELEKQVDAVDLAVRESYLNMKEAEKRFGATAVAVSKAEEDYFIANEKYRAGEGIMLDIIDAQLALSTAKTNYIQSQYDYAVNKAKLKNAMGLSEGELK